MLSPGELRFAEGAVRRTRVFLALSVAGVAVGLGLAAYFGYRRLADPAYPLGARVVVVLLVLLNARQNLRQYRYARLLSKLPLSD